MLRAWTDERLHYTGQYYAFDGVEVLPKPLQQPHPPVWTAASSPAAIAWSAAVGYSILMDPHSTHAEIGQKWTSYRDQLEHHGHSISGRDIPMARLVAVAPTDAEARQVASQGARWLIDAYVDPKRFGVVGDPVQNYVDRVIIHGSPERVVDELARLHQDIHLDYLIGAPLSHQSFLLLTEKVLPRLI